jgi:hypothetical protein
MNRPASLIGFTLVSLCIVAPGSVLMAQTSTGSAAGISGANGTAGTGQAPSAVSGRPGPEVHGSDEPKIQPRRPETVNGASGPATNESCTPGTRTSQGSSGANGSCFPQ